MQRRDERQLRRNTFDVQMGFALHRGWAVEGAIGSDQKIDAAYLSHHVKLSERLEHSNTEYGSTILMSDAYYTMLSETAKQCCRMVDVVSLAHEVGWSGELEPDTGDRMPIYTFDCITEDLSAKLMAIKLKGSPV